MPAKLSIALNRLNIGETHFTGFSSKKKRKAAQMYTYVVAHRTKRTFKCVNHPKYLEITRIA